MRIGGIVDVVLFDHKLKKGKGESGMELLWHKNRDFHHIYRTQKYELVTCNATLYDMNLEES